MKPELLPHQQEAIQFLIETKGRALIADDPGLGKTASCIGYLEQSQVYPALIVCPASVKASWVKEFLQWAGITATVLEGERPEEIDPGVKVVICNYDILRDQMPALVRVPFQCVVYDESHYLSNPSAHRTKAAKVMARRCKHVICLSGTPISNRPADFFPTLHIIHPGLYPSFSAYAWEYCDPKKTRWGWDYTGSSNLDKLHKAIQPFTIRRRKDEVLNLPEQRSHVVPIVLENAQEYIEAESDFIKWLSKNTQHGSVEKAKKAEAVVKVGYMLSLSARLKARAAVRWLRNYMQQHPEKKLILFCTHTAMLDVLYRRVFPDGVLMIDGSVPSNKRGKIVEQFQTDPRYRVIVCNTKAASAGITLTSASTTVFVELPWTASTVSQARDRNYRIGQDKDTDVIYLVAQDTIEERLCKVLQHKQQLQEQIIEGKKRNDLPVLDMLLAQTKNDKKKGKNQ